MAGSPSRAAFFDQHRDPTFQGLNILSYVADMHPTQSGVWVLLKRGDDDPAVLLHISTAGRRTGRWVFNGVRGAQEFVIDERNQRIFIAIHSTAEIVELPLPSPNSPTSGIE